MMRNQNEVIVLSSDDEDEEVDLSLSLNQSSAKSATTSSATPTHPGPSKRLRLSSSQLQLFSESSFADQVRSSFEDFDEFLNGSKVSTEAKWNWEDGSASGRNSTNELWADKYKPRSLGDLAVQKKKVEEVKIWFEKRLRNSMDEFGSHVLVIAGPAGVGKTATVRVIASHLGARLYEWDTPTPTIWHEHVHNCNTGVQYASKLDEFENFVERIRKYGLIAQSVVGESTSSAVLLIDDLPVTNERTAFQRLQKCLSLLVRSTQIPTAIVVTDCGKSDSGDRTARSFEELSSFLEDVGACKVAFNPITTNSIKKILLKICRQENCNLTAEEIDLLAKSSGGDIRHAVTTLQLFSLKQDPMLNLSLSILSPTSSKGKADEHNGFLMQFGRDETLSLFHALGKFLHNKREADNIVEMDQDAFLVKEKFSRLPLKMDAPEKVLCQAHGQARTIADFLHENVLDFLSDDAMDDAWAVASYLSDADLLLASFRGRLARYNEPENVLQSAAASVAVRGVLFGNAHPLPSRWHAIRRPKLWQVEQQSLRNKKEMVKNKAMAFNVRSSTDLSVFATDYAPFRKWLEYRASVGSEAHDSSMPDNKTEDVQDSVERMNLDVQESEISDSETE